jgi:hypothetical protein
MKETVILSLAWILTASMLIIYIPRDKIREAQVIFFFKQTMTWIIGLLVVELRLIEYPVEIFKYATKASFTFEYFIYPSLCAVFNLHYPNGKSLTRKLLYYSYYCTGMTVVEVLCERYTNIIKYIHWSWYITWITLLFTFYTSRKYYVWFFRLKSSGN